MGYTGPLADKDRIFTNLYGFQEPWLKAAQARGDWDKTADLMKLGQDQIIEVIKASGLRGRGGAGFPTAIKWGGVQSADAERKFICCNGAEG